MTRAMQDRVRLEVIEDAPVTDIMELEAQVDAFNALSTGIADARSLSIVLRDDNGEIYAGLHGHSWGRTCELKLLWVAERDRGRGLGTALLEAAEVEARLRQCRQIMLSTHSFQAPDFYVRHGFQRVAEVPDNPFGHADILMIKRLA
jgi:N-acetylglutamate synthase-like GNAT family acetyltransferase